MPHTFINNHTVRRSHNVTLPVNHKATRMHKKIHLNKPQVYSDDPNFFTVGEKKFFPRGIDTGHWNDLQTASIVWTERELQKDKEVLSYLKDLKSTYPDREVFVNVEKRIHTFTPHNCCYYCNCRVFCDPLDELIEKYTSYCQQLDEYLDLLDSLELYSYGDYDQRDYALLPKKSCKKTSHRISREKSLPKTRLERQIKKQIFFKKNHKVEDELIEEPIVEPIVEPVADEDYDSEEYYDMRFRRFEEMLCLLPLPY